MDLQGTPQVLGPPRGPYQEGRAAAPPRTLPRTVRSQVTCRLSYAPHSKIIQRLRKEAVAWDRRRARGFEAEVIKELEKADVFSVSRPAR